MNADGFYLEIFTHDMERAKVFCPAGSSITVRQDEAGNFDFEVADHKVASLAAPISENIATVSLRININGIPVEYQISDSE